VKALLFGCVACGWLGCGDDLTLPPGFLYTGPGNRQLVVAGDHLYFETYIDGEDGDRSGIHRLPLTGGFAEPLWIGDHDELMIAGPVLAGGSVFWASMAGYDSPGCALFSVPIDGGLPVKVADVPVLVTSLAADDSFVYAATSDATIVRTPLRGRTIEPIFTGSGELQAMTLDGSTLYFLIATSTTASTLWKVQTSGAAPAQIATVPPLNGGAVDPPRFFVDGGGVFVPTDHGVTRVAVATGNVSVIGSGDVTAIAGAGGTLYGTVRTSGGSSIVRFDGDTAVPLRSQLPYIGSLAVAATRLYFGEAEYSHEIYGAVGYVDL
jgi:hypothetical protein